MDCFSFGESTAQLLRDINPGFRIAKVLPLDAQSREDTLFASTVGLNRGVGYQEFEDIAEAQEWLK